MFFHCHFSPPSPFRLHEHLYSPLPCPLLFKRSCAWILKRKRKRTYVFPNNVHPMRPFLLPYYVTLPSTLLFQFSMFCWNVTCFSCFPWKRIPDYFARWNKQHMEYNVDVDVVVVWTSSMSWLNLFVVLRLVNEFTVFHPLFITFTFGLYNCAMAVLRCIYCRVSARFSMMTQLSPLMTIQWLRKCLLNTIVNFSLIFLYFPRQFGYFFFLSGLLVLFYSDSQDPSIYIFNLQRLLYNLVLARHFTDLSNSNWIHLFFFVCVRLVLFSLQSWHYGLLRNVIQSRLMKTTF